MMKNIFLSLAILATMSLANSLQEIRDLGVFRVAVYGNTPPFSTNKDGEFKGFEIDFSKKIAEKIFENNQGNVVFVPLEGNDRIKALQNNEVDAIIAMLTITEDRTKVIDFTMPYFSVNFAALTRKKDNIKSLSDLRDKTLIVRKEHLVEKEMQKKGYKLTTCQNSNECYEMLKRGEGVMHLFTQTRWFLHMR